MMHGSSDLQTATAPYNDNARALAMTRARRRLPLCGKNILYTCMYRSLIQRNSTKYVCCPGRELPCALRTHCTYQPCVSRTLCSQIGGARTHVHTNDGQRKMGSGQRLEQATEENWIEEIHIHILRPTNRHNQAHMRRSDDDEQASKRLSASSSTSCAHWAVCPET